MEQHSEIIISISGFIIITLISVIAFFGKREFVKLDGQYQEIKSWINSIRDMISLLRERVDESNLNTRLNQESISEIRREVQKDLKEKSKNITEIQHQLNDHEKRLNDIDKKLIIQKHIHNDLHPHKPISE